MKSWNEKSGVGIFNPKWLKQEPEEQSFFLAESTSNDQKPAPSYWFRSKVYNFGKFLSNWAEDKLAKEKLISWQKQMDNRERLLKENPYLTMEEIEALEEDKL